MRARLTLVTVLAVTTALLAPSDAAAKPPRPPATPTPPDLVVEWRRDVWQDADLRSVALTGATSTLVASVARDGQPRFSPDGSRLGGFLVPTGSTPWDVAMMTSAPDGTDLQVLIDAATFDAWNVARGLPSAREYGYLMPLHPGAWSPDGSTYVFAGQVRYPRRDPATGADDLFTFRLFSIRVDASGRGVPATLAEILTPTDAPVRDLNPTWSANGWLVFVRATMLDADDCYGWPVGQRELWAVRPGQPTTLRRLTDFASLPHTYEGVNGVVFSPDGSQLVVAGNLDPDSARMVDNGDLWLLDVTATSTAITVSNLRALRATAATEWFPDWSPDGTTIAFIERTAANRREVRSRLIVHNVATGQERILVEQTKQVFHYLDWNPAGRNVVW